MKMKLLPIWIFLILLALPLSVSAAKSYEWQPEYQRIYVSGGTEGDPVTFKDITDYFAANPITTGFRMPRTYGNETTYEISEEIDDWSMYWADGDKSTLGNITSITESNFSVQNNHSINITLNGTGDFVFGWNTNNTYVDSYYGDGRFVASTANKIKFKVYVNATSNMTLQKIRLKCYYSNTMKNQELYNMESYNIEQNLTNNTWTEVSIDLRDSFYQPYGNGYENGDTDMQYVWTRFYWYAISRIYFTFTGGDDGESLLIDDLHFEADDLDPYEEVPGTYIFQTPVYISGWFNDTTSFNVINDYLSFTPATSTGMTFYAAGAGLQLGGYGDEQTGGTITFIGHPSTNVYDYSHRLSITGGGSSNGFVESLTVQHHPIMPGPMDSYKRRFGQAITFGGVTLNDVTTFNDFDFNPGGDVKVNNYFKHGGRYGPYGAIQPGDVDISGFYIYQPDSYIMRMFGDYNNEIRDVNVYSDSNYFGYIYDNGYTANRTLHFVNVNFDGYTATAPSFYVADTLVAGFSPTVSMEYEVDIKVVDNDGDPIENVSVNITDSDGTVYSNMTDSGGLISTQTIPCWTMTGIDGTNTRFNLFYGVGTNNEPSLKYPFTITLEHDDYPDKEFTYNITEQTDWVINMEANYPWSINGTIVINEGAVIVHEC